MLTSFEVANFRAFKRLSIPRLGRVNLIVGKNSVGKTTLLEALRIYFSSSVPDVLFKTLWDREEFIRNEDDDNVHQVDYQSLHNGRSWDPILRSSIELGPIGDSSRKTRITYLLLNRKKLDDPMSVGYRFEPVDDTNESRSSTVQPGFKLEQGGRSLIWLPDRVSRRDRFHTSRETDPIVLSASGASEAMIANWWDAIVLRDAERFVTQCLSTIVPIERISLINNSHSSRSSRERTVVVLRKGDKEPVPLRSLGDGAYHIFQLALAMAFAGHGIRGPQLIFHETDEQGVLLVDEIESGVHYSIQQEMWRFIFRAARESQIQIFATTHSLDCIRGFEAAAVEDKQSIGVLVRLEKGFDDNIEAISIDEHELPIMMRESIEVR